MHDITVREIKIYLTLFAAAALAMTSCSKNEVIDTPAQQAIEFGTYTGNAAQTKATIVDGTTLQKPEEGFGVFAFYTANANYSSATHKEPNFMNNTKVTWNNSIGYEYSPIKYWPNTPNEMVSFFAYAPYDATKAWNANNPVTTFAVNNTVTDQIDLLYAKGVVDQTKQTIDGKVKFEFKHALARIDLNVAYAADQATVGGAIANGTVINVTKVTLGQAANSFYQTGALDMTKADAAEAWGDKAGTQTFVLTNTNNFVTTVADNVTHEMKQLNKEDSYVMVIPQDFSTDGFDVKIEYTVTTADTDLPNDQSVIDNVITKKANIKLEAGKVYNLNLTLGMTSVKLNAEVADWDEKHGATDNTVDLPLNN